MKIAIQNNYYSKNTRTSTTQRKISHPLNTGSSPIQNTTNNANISFTGLRSFFTSLIERNKNKLVVPTEIEKVFEILKQKEAGAYALTDKGYVHISPKEYKGIKSKNVSEIIIKQPESASRVGIGSDTAYEESIHTYRVGISPIMVMDFLDNGFSKATTIVDDGMHVITFPTSAKDRTKATNAFKQSGFIEAQQENTIYMMPEARPKFLFDLTKEMIDSAKVDGVRLEKLPLS